jgi:hypothetical protein
LLGDIKGRARADIARRKDIDIVLLPQSNIISADGQARDFSHQNGDIKEQETGVELALKLPQIVPITTTPGGRLAPRTAYSTALNRPRGTTFCSTLWRGSISLGRRYLLTNSSHPARGESFVSLCSAPHSPFLTIAFSLSQTRAKTNRGSRRPFLPLKTLAPQFPGRHLSLSLSLSLPRHSDIPTF